MAPFPALHHAARAAHGFHSPPLRLSCRSVTHSTTPPLHVRLIDAAATFQHQQHPAACTELLVEAHAASQHSRHNSEYPSHSPRCIFPTIGSMTMQDLAGCAHLSVHIAAACGAVCLAAHLCCRRLCAPPTVYLEPCRHRYHVYCNPYRLSSKPPLPIPSSTSWQNNMYQQP